ncbi:MAG: hypothetical protein M3033_04215 [Acidobacteriota bacterium]|nr:hypothetical protein [Acidobacteriota bacterium]
MKYQRTEIITETKLLFVQTKKESAQLDNCPECSAATIWVTPAFAAHLFDTDEKRICRLIETGALHFTNASGETKVCSRSLIEILNK